MSEIARAARKASQPKPIGSSLDGMLTPVRAPQLWHILSVALIGTPQALHFGMAKLSRAEQQPKGYGGQPAKIEYWAGMDEFLSAADESGKRAARRGLVSKNRRDRLSRARDISISSARGRVTPVFGT